MHNKFIVINNELVFTGSMNFGIGSMFEDYNNVVMIHDSALAANYKTEFNEMWGGSGAQPNSTNSKFGPDKTDNTQHSFSVSGTPVYLYFSPTDGTTSRIVDAINTANYKLDIAMFTFINNDLGDAVVAAKQRGVTVRAIIENVSYFGSEYQSLVNNGITVLSHESITYDFHHKYCIIDALYSNSDPIVVTGSYNWTNSAEEDNDENTLIIHDFTLANQYLEEFTQRFNDIQFGVNSLSSENGISIYPNPFSNYLELNSESDIRSAEVHISTIDGIMIYKNNFNLLRQSSLNVESLRTGTYL